MSRDKAVKTRKKWMQNKNNYCIVDTETTGLGGRDRIVEIAIIDLDGNVLLNTLVNPGIPIDKGAERIHGISNAMVANAPDIAEVRTEVKRILRNRIMIAYNAKFDARMIRQTFRLPVQYECLMHNVMDYIGTSRFVKLEVATAGIRTERQEHRALDDCYLCLKLIQSTPGLEEEVS